MAKLRGLLEVTDQELEILESMDPLLRTKLVANTRDESLFTVYKQLSNTTLIPRFLCTDKMADALQYKKRSELIPKIHCTFGGTLRDYQVKAVSESVRLLKNHSGMLLQAGCGTGKTVMALKIAEQIGRKTCVLVDQIDIAKQWQERIQQFLPGATVEIIGNGKGDAETVILSADFTIIIAQSLWRVSRQDNPIKTGLLIVDEAHVFSAPKFFEAITNIDFIYSLALTATPKRKDGLEWVFQITLGNVTLDVEGTYMKSVVKMIRSRHFTEASQEDFKTAWCNYDRRMTWFDRCRQCPLFDLYPSHCGGRLPLTQQSPPQVKWDNQSIMFASLIQAACGDPTYINWIVSQIDVLISKGRQILVLGASAEILKTLYKLCLDKHGSNVVGLFIGAQHNVVKKADRKNELNKQLTFATNGVAEKAIDVPHKDCLVLTTPMSDITQAKGRVERIKDGKKTPIIIDLVHENIPMFKALAAKRRKQYLASGSRVDEITLD